MTHATTDRVETLDALIAALGGPSAVGKMFGYGHTAVSNWLAKGRLPDRVSIHTRLREEAARMDLQVDEAVWSPSREAA